MLGKSRAEIRNDTTGYKDIDNEDDRIDVITNAVDDGGRVFNITHPLGHN
jgi:hypothetical protein